MFPTMGLAGPCIIGTLIGSGEDDIDSRIIRVIDIETGVSEVTPLTGVVITPLTVDWVSCSPWL